jgi:cytochrome c oxidase subunit 2
MKIFADISSFSNDIDQFTMWMVIASTIVTVGIIVAIIVFSTRYHASKVTESVKEFTSWKLEWGFLVGTLIVFMAFFTWATQIYRKQIKPLTPDYKVFVYGKRWMWKFHHQNGFVEINELHLPVGKNIRFTMISEDVIHSLYFPDFRIKQDVLPERYTVLALKPTKTGTYPLFCTEYCGTAHSAMMGATKVVDEKAYLEAITLYDKTQKELSGRDLFIKHDCVTCHTADQQFRQLSDDTLRASILYPTKAMPSYKNVLTEEETMKLIEYIKQTRTRL